ncbi:hypothetical protein [Streptomyces broussonetiae]
MPGGGDVPEQAGQEARGAPTQPAPEDDTAPATPEPDLASTDA